MTETIDLKKLLTVGTAARYQEYVNLVQRMKTETLSLAEQRLFDHLHAQLASHHEETTGRKSGRSFSTRRAIADYLAERGYKVTKSTVDNHIKRGKLRPQKNGTFTLEDVERYAAANLPHLDGSASKELDEIQRKKIDLDIRRDIAETELAELKLNSRKHDLITGPLEAELAGRLRLFRSDGENFILSRSSALIAACGGDQARTAEFVALFRAAFETWLARYAKGCDFLIDAAGNVTPPMDSEKGDTI
jgi:hypothetical protein